jgi:hypothetical protein
MANGAVTSELKVVVGVVQQNQGAIKSILNDLNSVLAAVKKLGTASADPGSTQLAQVGQAAQQQAAGSSAAVQQLQAETEKLRKQLAQISQQNALKKPGQDAKESVDVVEALNSKVEGLMRGLKFLAGGFLGLELVRFLKDMADAAARAQVLGTTLHVVGQNFGYTGSQLDALDKQLQRLGITASASRQALVQMLQARIPVEIAPQLARAAQDLAVVTGENSSKTFQRMITNIEQLDTVGLRYMGITIQNSEAQARYAASIGKTADQLNRQQQVQALAMAVLDKATTLSGAYEAAMGDVGKQTSSLERYFENLKVAIGNNLLPAYLAIVEELTLFLQELQLVADETSASTDNAQRFGDVVRFVASTIREGAMFLVEHRVAVASLIGVWASVKTIVWTRDFFKGFWGEMKDAGRIMMALLAPLAEAIGLELGLAGSAGTAAVAQTGLGVATVGTTAALGAEAGVLATLQAGFIALAATIGLPIEALAAIIITIIGLVALVFNVGGSRDYIANLIDKLRGVDPAAGGGNLDGLRRKADEAKKKATDARVAYEKVMATASTPEEQERAKKKFEDAYAESKKEEDAFYAAIDALKKVNPKAAELAEALAARRKKVQDLNDLKSQLIEAKDKLFGKHNSFTASGEEAGGEFQATAQSLRTVMEAVGKVPVDAAAARLRVGLRNLADAAKTPADLKTLQTDLETWRKKVAEATDGKLLPEDARNATQALETARLKVRNAVLAQTADIASESKGMFEAAAQARIQNAQQELEDLKGANERAQQQEQFQYGRGLVLLETYFADRRARMQAEFEAERKAQVAEVAKAEGEVRQARTPIDAANARNQLQAAQHKLAQLPLEQQGRLTQLGNDQLTAQEQALREINDLHAQLNDLLGNEDAKMEAITEKYRRRRQELKNPTNDELTTVNRLEQAEKANLQQQNDFQRRDLQNQVSAFYDMGNSVGAVNLKFDRMREQYKGIKGADVFIEQLRQIELMKAGIDEANASLQRTIDQEKAFTDLQREQVAHAQRTGQITDQQAQNINNELTRREMGQVQSQIAEKYGEIAKLEAQGLTEESAQVQEVRTQLLRLDAELTRMGDSIVTYGQKVTRGFTEGLSGGIKDLITHSKSAVESLVDMANNWKDRIAGALADNAAQKATQWVLRKTSKPLLNEDGSQQVDEQGRPMYKQGSSIFDSMAKTLGFDSKKEQDLIDKSQSRPMKVIPVGAGGMPALGGGVDAHGLPDILANNPFIIKDDWGSLGKGLPDQGKKRESVESVFIPETDSIAQPVAKEVQKGIEKGANSGFSNMPGILQQLGGGVTQGLSSAVSSLFGGLFKTGKASGGPVSGPGTSTSDSIPALLSHGEFVVRASQASKNLGLLTQINNGYHLGGLVRQLADGGLASLQSIAMPPLVPANVMVRGTANEQAAAVPVQRGQMVVQMHPDDKDMTMRQFMERELARMFR